MARSGDSKVLNVVVKEGDRKKIRAFVEAKNQSLSDYIRQLIENDMGIQLEPIEHGGYRRGRKSEN